MKFCKKTLSFILALVLLFSSITPVSAKNDADPKKTTIKGQEVIIEDTAYYIFSTDKNAKSDLIKAHEKGELQLEKLKAADGLEISDVINQDSVGSAQAIPYTINIKGKAFTGVGGNSFDWDTLPEGLDVQVTYFDDQYNEVSVGSPVNVNRTNFGQIITRTFDIPVKPEQFAIKTNVDADTYLTDVKLTDVSNPHSNEFNITIEYELVQIPSTNLSIKWVDEYNKKLGKENTPAEVLPEKLTFNFIKDYKSKFKKERKFELPNYDKKDINFRLNNKVRRSEVKDMEGATALVDGKKDGEEVTLDGKIYKLTTSYDPAFNKGSNIQLMYMPDVIDRTNNPEAETPDKYVRVTIDAGEGTKLAKGEKKKVYDVRIGKVLKAEHYPKLEISDKAKYKEPITWTIAPETAITKKEDILGKADKTAAEKITAANLKAVDTTALQGQELDEKFWHDGVELAENTPADKKAEFEALLKEATVTDKSSRTTTEAGDKVGTLLVTFKDGSTLEVEKQKLIVKPSTITVELDKDSQSKEKPVRHGDTIVKGKVTADATEKQENGYKVNLNGAVVTIKDNDGKVIGVTIADKDGNFTAGTRELKAGEKITASVTLPKLTKESTSAPITVQLNPDKLNEIIPTGEAVVKNLKGKKSVDQTKVEELEKAIKKALDEMVDKDGKIKTVEEDGKTKSKVEVSTDGQKSLDDQYEAIKKAIEALTSNNIPEIKGEAYKEIFKGDALDLNKVVVDVQKEEGKDYTGYVELIDDDNVAAKPKTEQTPAVAEYIDLKDQDKPNKKYYTISVEKQKIDENTKAISWENVDENDVANINNTAGTYKVTYFVEDNFGVKATHTMTLVVKEPVIEVPGEFPTPTPEGYVKVEFKSGDHAGLQGTSKYLVKKDSAKDSVKVPTIVPEEGWKIDDPAWTKEVPAKFESDFETTARVLEKVKTTEPEDKDRDKYATVEFKAGDHGTFEKVDNLDQITKFWVLKDEKVTFNVPTVTEADNYKFTGWDNKVQASYKTDTIHTATYKEKVVTKDPKDTTNYAKLTFEKGDHGKFGANAQTTLWVLKDTEVTFNAPNVIANKDFTFDKWDPEIKKSYSGDQTHTAKYTSDKNVSDVPVAGFQEVKFTTDVKDGKFVNEKSEAEKSVWVRPNTLVDLTDKAPSVTVTNNKKAFTGWSQKLIAEFAKADQATEIKAVYKDKVLTEEPKDKTGYAEVKFVAGNHGTFANAQEKTTFWVLKNEEVTFKVPTVTAKDGYTFKAWDPEVKKSYSEDQTHTATYKTNDSISDTPVEGFQEVKFLSGDDGKFENDKTEKSVWVEPGVLVDLRAKAPKVTANKGKVHTGWDKDLVAKFEKSDQATEIKAVYKDKVLTEEPKDKTGYVTVEFKAGDHGTLTGTTKFWVYKNEEVTFNAPTVTPADKYSFIGWKEPVKTVYTKDTKHTAQYSKSISDKYVEGWTEITFNSGDHGRFVADAKTVKWVNPKADVKLSDMAPGITPDTNYSFKSWTKPGEGANAQALEVALDNVAKYDKAVTFTATYESDISNTEKTGFVKVTFAPGENGKFVENSTTEVYVKADKDVDLRAKAPKVMPNTGYGHTGWSQDLAKVNVKKETTITATYTKGEFDAKNITSFDILGPKKAAYAEGDKLDLTGFTVVAIDKSGIRKEYTVQDNKLKNGEEELTGVTLKVGETTIDLANLPKLNHKAHDDKPITLTKDEKDYNSTVHLSVSMTRTNQPTDLVAANQGENPTETKIKGKAQKGDTVKIYVPGQKDPIKKVEVTNEDGSFETSVKTNENKPYPVGTKFNVTATGKDKAESSPQEVKVIKDVNGDWEDDGEGQKTPTPTAEALNVGKDPKVTTITGKAEKGAKVVAKVGDKVVGEATADPQTGEYKIEAKKDGAALPKDTEVKVTAQVEGKLVSEPATAKVKVDKDGNGVDDEKEKFDIKKATKVEILQNPYKMKYSVTEKTGKTPFDAKGVIIRLTDASGKTATYNYDDIIKDENKGKFTLSPADKEEIGLGEEAKVNTIPFTVTVTGADTKPSVTAKENITVILDKDGNGVDDRTENTPVPDVIARNIGTDGPDGKKVPATKTTVEIKTEKNAKVTIEYTDKDGHPQKIENLTADDQGKLTKEITPKLEKGTDVKVTVQDGEKKPTDKTVKVFDDLDGDKIPDTKAGQTERPAALASNIGKKPEFTTITGEAEKGATVTAKVGNEVVGTATADSKNGKYTIEAKQNEKPIKEGVKIDVTATLAPKAESLKQTVVVFNDTDGTGQPDSAKDFDVKKTTGMQVVASPDKMVYSDGDKLNLDGLKVLLTDVNGNQKIFTYNSKGNKEFTDAGLSVDLKQDTELSSKDYNAQTAKDGHNGRKLVVTLDTTGNTSAEKAIRGETPTALTVNKNQSAQPTDVVAANQGDAIVTKVKGKATKDAEIKITDASGQSLLPKGTTINADANGDFTADLNKLLDPETKVFVTATEPGKSESPKAETSVIRDKNGNWKPDTGAKLSTPVIDPIREKDEKVVVAAPTADDKIQTITVEDQNGKTVTLTKDPADTTGKTWIVEGTDPAEKVVENNEGKLEIPVKDKLPLNDRDQIKVTFKDGENPANEAFDKAPVQKASQTPKVDPVYTGDKNVKIADPTVADPTAKTIKVKVGDNDSMTVEKQPDGSWKVKEDQNKEVKVEDGKIVVPLDPSAKKGDVIKVSTINDSGKASPEAKVTVVDKEKSTTPEVKPVATNDTKITGTAGPNADVVITITPKNGGEAKEIVTKADKDGNFTVPADGLKDGDTIVAKATETGKAPAESAPVTVGVDKSKLINAIGDGEKKLGDRKPEDYTPADKKLKEAIEEGKTVKDNPDASQNDVNEKTKAIEDAIKEKEETDKALDELKKAKEELDKTIKDARDDRKPREEIKKGQDSSKDAGTVIDKKGKDKDGKDMTSDQIKELVEKTKEADRRLKLPVIQVAINTAVNDGQNIIFTTNPGRCKVTVTILRKDRSKEIYTSETGAGGTGSLSIEKPLETGDSILIKATRITDTRLVPDYLDNYTSTGV